MYSKERELKYGLMDPNMMACTLMVKKKDKEYSHGKMVQVMKEDFTLIVLKAKVHINGLMVDNLQVIG